MSVPVLVTVVPSLSRVDGRRLLRHPAFLAGVALTVAGTVWFLAAAFDGGATWEDDGWTTAVGAFMLGVLTMVATNMAALRDRREHTTEQHAALPVGPAPRIVGLLVATAWPAAATGVLLMIVAAIAASRGVGLTAAQVVLLVERVWSVVLLGAVGVALAVWIPRSFVVGLVAWAVLFLTPGETPRAWHALLPFETFETGATTIALWHLVYVVGLTGLVVAVALARAERRSRVLALAGASLAVAAGAAAVLLLHACPAGGPCWL